MSIKDKHSGAGIYSQPTPDEAVRKKIERVLIGFRNEVQRGTRDTIIQPGTKVLPNIENGVAIIKNAHETATEILLALLQQAELEARLAGAYLSLQHLKDWAELHQLDAEQIMDGIEHMQGSIAQQQSGEIPVQPEWKAQLEAQRAAK